MQAGCERAIRNVGETVYWWARDGLMAYGGGIPDRLSAPLSDAGYTDMCMGEDGHKLWLSGETVYWWARDGLMAYGGGIPDRLSAPLSDAGYTDMCMGEDGHKLWLSGLRDGQPETLVYDIEQGAFLPVDSRKAVQLAYHDGARYLAEETALWKTGTDRKNTDFAAVFGPFRLLPVDSRKAVQLAYHDGARYLAEETALWKTGTDRKNTDFAAVFGPFRRTAPAVLTGLTILADCVGECTLACAVRTERGDWMPARGQPESCAVGLPRRGTVSGGRDGTLEDRNRPQKHRLCRRVRPLPPDCACRSDRSDYSGRLRG